MKTTLISLVCLLTISTAIGFWRASSVTNLCGTIRQQSQADVKLKQTQIDEFFETVSNQEQQITNFQTRLKKVSAELNANRVELASAEQKISDLEAYKKSREDKEAIYLAQVPGPLVTTDELGHKKFVFSKVVGAGGGTLLTDATFSGLYGRRLAFRADGDVIKAYDVDEMHPLMLKYLSINAEAAKVAQKHMSEAAIKQQQAQYAQMLQDQQAWAIQREANGKIAIEQQKLAAEQAAKQTELETERIKANAAMIQAQKPPNQLNIIQQSQQNQRVIQY